MRKCSAHPGCSGFTSPFALSNGLVRTQEAFGQLVTMVQYEVNTCNSTELPHIRLYSYTLCTDKMIGLLLPEQSTCHTDSTVCCIFPLKNAAQP